MASAPTLGRVLNLWSITCNQLPNTLATLQGGYKPEDIWMTRHIERANLHWKNKYFIVSSWWKKTHCEIPCRFLLIRLYLLRMTPRRRYHAKNLFLRGIFIFQIFLLLSTGTSNWINALYIESTENCPFSWRFHRNTSDPCENCTMDKPLEQDVPWLESGSN